MGANNTPESAVFRDARPWWRETSTVLGGGRWPPYFLSWRTPIRAGGAQAPPAHTTPRQRGKGLTGDLAGYWRYRIGDWRVVVEIRDEELVIIAIGLGHRSKITERSDRSAAWRPERLFWVGSADPAAAALIALVVTLDRVGQLAQRGRACQGPVGTAQWARGRAPLEPQGARILAPHGVLIQGS